MKCDSYSCIGESHIASGKPCQDRSLHWCDDRSGVCIVVVCDGHGGDRYFRSDKGAEFLCEITKESLCSFAATIRKKNKKLKSPLFVGTPFTQVSTVRDSQDSLPRQSAEDETVKQLLSSIVAQWREKIENHAQETPVSEWELANVKSEYLTDFEQRRSIEKVYGCTLIAYLQTKDYWLALHLGDGKCIMFDVEDECSEPILWDEKCFLNRTTSICDPAPIDEFRYSYRGDGVSPVAIFLGSDGIDDSYGDGERLHNFYLNVLRMLASDGKDAVHQSLVDSLPIISKKGSRDDMSVAFVYDESLIEEHSKNLTKKQLGMLDIAFAELKDKAQARKRTVDEFAGEYERKRASLRKGDTSSSEFKDCEKLRINLKYADSEYKSLITQLESLKHQATSLYEFLGKTPSPQAYEIEDSEHYYNARITSFIDGSYGKECDQANSSSETDIPNIINDECFTDVHEGSGGVNHNTSDTVTTEPQESDPSYGQIEEIKRVLGDAVKSLTSAILPSNKHRKNNSNHEKTDSNSSPSEMQEE